MATSAVSFPRLAGKTVLITGGSSGIGAASALLFAQSGSNVVLTARREKELSEVVDQCKKAGKGHMQGIVLDMADKTALASILDKLDEPVKDVHVLVNNAGFAIGTERVGEIAQEDIETVFNTNVLGLIQLTQILVRHFKARGAAGHIINLGSIAGVEAYPAGSIYCASKFAVNAFTTSLRKELISSPIRVTEVQPGMVETNFSVVRYRGDKSAADKVYTDVVPLTATDIAEEILWAASRPVHVNIAETLVFPSCQAGGPAYMHRGPQQ